MGDLWANLSILRNLPTSLKLAAGYLLQQLKFSCKARLNMTEPITWYVFDTWRRAFHWRISRRGFEIEPWRPLVPANEIGKSNQPDSIGRDAISLSGIRWEFIGSSLANHAAVAHYRCLCGCHEAFRQAIAATAVGRELSHASAEAKGRCVKKSRRR